MPKIRVYKVIARNVHGDTSEYIVPAHSSDAARQGFNNPDLAYEIRYVGFQEVVIHYGGSAMTFQVLGTLIESGHPSYDYMYSYFTRDIDAFVADLQRTGEL